MELQFPQCHLLEARDHALFVRVSLMTGPKKHSRKIVGINKCKTEYRTLSYCQAVKPSDLFGNLDSLQTGNTQGNLKPFTTCRQGTRNYIQVICSTLFRAIKIPGKAWANRTSDQLYKACAPGHSSTQVAQSPCCSKNSFRSSFWQQSVLPKGGTVIHATSQNPFLYCDTFSDLLQCEKWYPCGSKAFPPRPRSLFNMSRLFLLASRTLPVFIPKTSL